MRGGSGFPISNSHRVIAVDPRGRNRQCLSAAIGARLAADAAHLYANIEQQRPYATVLDVAAMMEGHRTLEKLASSPAHIIPGHDPLVMERYPAAAPGLEGIAVRLDADPRG